MDTNSNNNRNLYICLFLKEKKVDGNIVLDVGILASATRATDKAEEKRNIDDWNRMMKTYIEKNVDPNFKEKLKAIKNNEDYVKALSKIKFNKKLLDLIKGKIDKNFKTPVYMGKKKKIPIWKDYMLRVYEEGDEKFNDYLNDDGYEISPVYILLNKKK